MRPPGRIAAVLALVSLTLAGFSYASGGAATTSPHQTLVLSGVSLPTTCIEGDVFYKTSIPKTWYDCGPDDTWSTQPAFASLSVPTGIIVLLASGACPATYTEVTALAGHMISVTVAANADVGTTGGADSVTPAGGVSAPTFAGDAATSSLVSGGTPTGTVSAPSFSGAAWSAPAFSWPAGAPTFSGSPGTVPAQAFTGSTGTVPAQAFSGSPGTVPAQVVSWPAGVPAFSGTQGTVPAETISGSAASITAGTPAGSVSAPTFTGTALATHSHELPFQLVSATSVRQIASSTFGTGTSRAAVGGWAPTASTTSAAVAKDQALTAGTPAGTNSAPTFTGSALAAHGHAVGTLANASTLFTPAGTVSWPAGVPTNGTASFTPAGTNGTVAFTPAGTNGTANFTPSGTVAWPVSVPTLAAYTPSGTIGAPAFTGAALATHGHTMTPTGTVSAPLFTGTALDNRPAFVRMILCRKD